MLSTCGTTPCWIAARVVNKALTKPVAHPAVFFLVNLSSTSPKDNKKAMDAQQGTPETKKNE